MQQSTLYDWHKEARSTYRYLECQTNKQATGILIIGAHSDTLNSLGERGYLTGQALKDFQWELTGYHRGI